MSCRSSHSPPSPPDAPASFVGTATVPEEKQVHLTPRQPPAVTQHPQRRHPQRAPIDPIASKVSIFPALLQIIICRFTVPSTAKAQLTIFLCLLDLSIHHHLVLQMINNYELSYQFGDRKKFSNAIVELLFLFIRVVLVISLHFCDTIECLVIFEIFELIVYIFLLLGLVQVLAAKNISTIRERFCKHMHKRKIQ